MAEPKLGSIATRMRPGIFAELEKHMSAFAAKGGEMIGLHIGDTYLQPPPEARIAAANAPDSPDLYSYGPTAGLSELRDAIGAHLRSRNRAPKGLDPHRHLFIGTGGTHALFAAARAVLDPGDDVLMLAPYWPLAPGVFHACGARPVEVPFTSHLYARGGPSVGEILTRALTPKAKAIYFISPNNPDGKVLSLQHLESIRAFAERHNLWIFADEVYADFAFDAPHVPMLWLPGASERTIALYSFSKSHGMAGARIGYVVGPEAVISVAKRVGVHTVFSVPLAIQRAALGALLRSDGWTATARAAYKGARDRAVSLLGEGGFRFHVPEGGVYVFLDLTDVLGDRPLSELLLHAVGHGVLLTPGDACGESYEKWARLCYTSVRERKLEEGIARLREAVSSW